MTTTPVKTLPGERYAEKFAVFVARSEEYPAMTERLVELTQAHRDGFACLDVGAGTGKVLRDWLARGGPRPGRYVAVEPDRAHAKELRRVVGALGLDAVIHEEGFHRDFAIPGAFELVLFSHSLYWMADPIGCVRQAWDALTPGGFIVAFLQAPFGVHPLFRLFNPRFDRDVPHGPNHDFSSAELVWGLRDAGLEPKLYLDPTPIDLTGLFDPGKESERDDFLSFCLQVEFTETPEPMKTDIITYLRAACVEQEGRLLWYEPNATVVVSR